MTTDLAHLAATAIARARDFSPLSTPAFDYHISIHGIGGPGAELGNQVYGLATEGMPADATIEQREAAWHALWEQLLPELQAYETRCRNRKFAGWSNAAQARGQRISYV